MSGAHQRHGRWILAFALATSHLFVTGGVVQAGVENYLDRFEARSYSNSNGSLVWSGPWQEVGETSDPLAGDWQVVEDAGFTQYALGKKGAEGLGVQRVADLEGFSSATLMFDYRRNFLPSGKCVEVQASANGAGGPWTSVHNICGASPPVSDPAYTSVSLDISGFISSVTTIRFLHPSTSSSFGTPMALYIDNVEIVGDLTNSAPVLEPIGSLTGDEGSTIQFSAVATDPDSGDALTFSLGGSSPSGASVSEAGVFTWTPTESQGPGTYIFDVIVTDDGVPTLSEFETITVNVQEVNAAPVVSDPGDQTNGEGDSVSLTGSASDPDIPSNTLTWSATGLPAGLSMNTSTGEISGIVDHSAASASPHWVQVTVSDGVLEGSVSFQWTITDENRAPVLAPIGNPSGEEKSEIAFTASAIDPDYDDLTFSVDGSVPAGAIMTSDGLFAWTPSEAQGPGTYVFDVVVGDNGTPTLSDSETITVLVQEKNDPPAVASPGNQTNGEGDSVSMPIMASDPDVPADTLTWSANDLPPGLSIDASTGVISGVLPYSAAKSTPYTTQVSVTDGQFAASTTFAWNIVDTNRAPSVSEIAAQTIGEGTPMSLAIAASDPDGDALTFSLSGSVPAGADITTDGLFSWTPTELHGPGSYTFDVVATDSGSPTLSDTAEIEVEVKEVNIAPVAVDDRYAVIHGGTLAVGAAGLLANDFDLDDHHLSAWLVVSPTSGTVELSGDGSFIYTHSGATDNDDSFAYRISDGYGGHATAMVDIDVQPHPNQAPFARRDTIRLDEDSVVSIDVLDNDSDPDGDSLRVSAVALAQEGVVEIEEASIVRFVPGRDFNGTARAAYTVEDDHGAKSSAEVIFEVTAVNDDPYAVADHFVLNRYLSQHIPVLANDTDPDGDALILLSAGDPGRGEIAMADDGIIYTAPKGWTGTTSFTYVIVDGMGGMSEGVVSVEVPVETLVAARLLSAALGTDELKSEWVEGEFESKLDLAMSPLVGLQLFVQAFFQSLDGIELSLTLLGITAIVLSALSLLSRLPLVVPFGSPRYWSAVLVGRESQLEIREKPCTASKVIYQLRPATKGIESEPARRLMPRGWIPVETPRGQGWAETSQLTEQVDAQSFMEDERPSVMVDKLANKLTRGKDISRLVGDRGLIVDVGQGIEVIPRDDLSGGVGRLRWGRRSPLHAALASRVVTPFLEAYRSSGEISAEASHSSSVLLPTEILNFRYLTVGVSGTGSWLVLFEYQRGRPRVVGILRDE
ncbi:MAG TPA: Ig-like domain-containing protein [Acidimicrobiia bacterium]|nr:Ig-like domain-containing protein [Acidimicrobiia bacterium]